MSSNPIQAGVGYGFTSSGFGFTLNTTPPFEIPSGDFHPFQVRYDGAKAYVRSGSVNNEVMPDQELEIANNVTKQIYIECHASEPPTAFPTSVTCDFGNTVPADDTGTGYKLIATITNGVVTQYVYTSLGGERHKYENPAAVYYYFWRS